MIAGEQFVVLSFPVAAPKVPAGLTPAQREIVAEILAGRSNEEIARKRRTSPRTVANQIASIFRALGVKSRGALVLALMSATEGDRS